MKQRLVVSAGVVAVILGISVAYSLRPSGQQPPAQGQRLQVNLVRVKPDMVDSWIDFQIKRTIPALKKAGIAQRDVYQAAYGPLGEFRLLTPISKFADRDNPGVIERALGAAAAKEYNESLRKMIASQTTYVIQRIADASFDPNPNATYKVMVLSSNHVAPGRSDDYLNFIRNDLLPVQKKGQVKRYTVSQLIFGGDANEFRSATYMDKFADLDAGPAAVRVLGADGATKLLQKTAGIVMRVERGVYVHNEELSFSVRPTT
jgi:hypothetical protein